MIGPGLGSSWNISTQRKQYPSNLSFVHDYFLNKAVRSDVSTCVGRCVEACTQPCRGTFLSIGMVWPRKTQDFHFRHICFFTDMFHQFLLCGCVSPTISWDFPLELNRFPSLHLHCIDPFIPAWNWIGTSSRTWIGSFWLAWSGNSLSTWNGIFLLSCNGSFLRTWNGRSKSSSPSSPSFSSFSSESRPLSHLLQSSLPVFPSMFPWKPKLKVSWFCSRTICLIFCRTFSEFLPPDSFSSLLVGQRLLLCRKYNCSSRFY